MFNIVQILVGAGLASAGFIVRRIWTGESAREKATLVSTYATIAATMKSQGLSDDDIEAVSTLIDVKKKLPKPELITSINDFPLHETQSAMNIRAAGGARVAAAELDSVLSELTFLIGGEEAPLLATAQASWERYAGDHAKMAAAPFEGGSMKPLIFSAERESLTRQRIANLQALLEERKRG